MQLGITVRNMGPQSSRDTLQTCVMCAEQAGMESIWITDHLAIPPDDAEGSGGRYLDTLTTLAWIAGITKHIKLGSGVLIVPYRPKLPTLKQIATLQELSDHRLLLGVGVGWMDAEFRALGIDRHQRGKITDETLAFFKQAFEQDQIELNGQAFLSNPRPTRPPFLIGGRAPHALRRAVQYGDGWLPMARHPDQISEDIKEYRRLCAQQDNVPGSVSVMGGIGDPPNADLFHAYEDLGVDRLVCAVNYNDSGEYRAQIDGLAKLL